MALSLALRRALLTAVVVAACSSFALAQPTGAVLSLLDANNRRLDPARDSLGFSRRITHDDTLPRELVAETTSDDPENFRLELEAPGEARSVVHAHLESIAADGTRNGLLRHVPLVRVAGSHRFRSTFVRLVADTTDGSAPDVGGQLLRAALRDRVRATIDGSDTIASELSIGSLQHYDEARSPLRGTLRISVVRVAPGGPPAVGDDPNEATSLARRQVEIANEIWAQCFIEFGPPAEAFVQVVDPPPPALLAIGDLDGLPTLTAASVQFRAHDRVVGPIAIARGSTPEKTASTIARALRKAGLRAEVSVNPRAELGAASSADVVVRDARGQLVGLEPLGATPLTSDPQQSVTIGAVDLSDGLDEFDNTLAVTGTLEERTLVKLVADNDPSTIDVFLINRFVNRARQGEAFIEADGSTMANTLIFDRNAVRFERQAWVQAHELGHVLLDEAFHPDNIGLDRPWLLMDADARQGRVTGPKRISDAECARARRRSGPNAHPALLRFVRE